MMTFTIVPNDNMVMFSSPRVPRLDPGIEDRARPREGTPDECRTLRSSEVTGAALCATLCSVGALKIYFAGPLFTPYERSFIDECAAALRADGFEVFVPHEHELATGVDVTAAWIFAKDRPGIERADAMVAILDGPSVDDGTACEIGMFHALMQSDPSKKGIVGLLTDIRGMRGESTGVNLFVQGAIEDVGRIVASIEEARDVLRAWG